MIAQYFLKKLLNVTFFNLLSAMKATLLASMIAMTTTFLLYSSGVHYILCAIALGASYGSIIWLSLKEELIDNFKSIKNAKKKEVISV
jgi:hypothetical protein